MTIEPDFISFTSLLAIAFGFVFGYIYCAWNIPKIVEKEVPEPYIVTYDAKGNIKKMEGK